VTLPVKASEPKSVTRTLSTRASAPSAASASAKTAAAFIGPTVCDEDGPRPILKRSKTLIKGPLPRGSRDDDIAAAGRRAQWR